MSKTKTIIVAGGAGFIGSNLCVHLINQSADNHVICVDNMITGCRDNLREIDQHPRFRFVHHDVCTEMTNPTLGLDADARIDEIYHLASIASPEKYKKYPMETLLTSINGTQRILDCCISHQCKMLFTSTSEVYGDPLVNPQPEEYYGNVNTVGERSCYDEGKRVAETLIYECRKKHGLDLKIARLFNTYGPKMDLNDGRVITNFMRQIRNGKPVEIYGDGSQTRSFCYIDDMIRGLVAFMAAGPDVMGPMNLGNPDCEFTMNELVSVFETALSKQITVIHLPKTQDDPMCRKPVISKAVELIGFDCEIGLNEGINRLWNYFSSTSASASASDSASAL
jgi:UDP-glucuronate decarboxylase